VSLCFSKGLGAPVGSVVAGAAGFIRGARRTRKALGGGMRQAGILGAAARLALRDGPARLQDDHARARRLATALAALPPLRIDPDLVETNILMVEIPGHQPEDLLQHLAREQILASQYGPHRVRMVFHRDLTDEHVDRCIAQVTRWAQRAGT
jgi:threonine aldolase